MPNRFEVQPWELRASASASRDVAESLIQRGDIAADESIACLSTLGGFTSVSALATIARSWQGQVRYIGEGYFQAGNALRMNADAYESAEATAVNALQLPHG
ncbi:hypothetical protein [Yinghuangia sp. YIM S10712]|uniref:hypothetical protein n=1 Tax=Yinghuangia sp. YIM S10712 TaxID=3436930 RepID=UPI003F537CDB